MPVTFFEKKITVEPTHYVMYDVTKSSFYLNMKKHLNTGKACCWKHGRIE